MPVTLPPGRARLSTRPASTGSTPAPTITIGIVLVAFLAARISGPSCCHDEINLETHQLGHKLREPIALPLRISVLDGDVLSFDVATLAQSQPNRLGTGGVTS